jgi:hypothetical protein
VGRPRKVTLLQREDLILPKQIRDAAVKIIEIQERKLLHNFAETPFHTLTNLGHLVIIKFCCAFLKGILHPHKCNMENNINVIVLGVSFKIKASCRRPGCGMLICTIISFRNAID